VSSALRTLAFCPRDGALLTLTLMPTCPECGYIPEPAVRAAPRRMAEGGGPR
jgi:hypothetical protein